MQSNTYPTYEEAAREYLAKFTSLMQPQQDVAGATPRGALDLPSEVLVQRAEEISDTSERMFELAEGYLNSADPLVREGIRSHFIDQATIELLAGIELIKVGEDKIPAPAAASIVTHSAALREAMSAVEKSSGAPITQGIPVAESYRASESATLNEAAAGLRLALESSLGNITHRVQDLGGDIAFDLAAKMQWTEVLEGAFLSVEEVAVLLESIGKGNAGKMLLHAYKKTTALLDDSISADARNTIRNWLDQIRQADRVDVFHRLVEDLYKSEALKKSAAAVARSAATVESINKATDLIRALSDKCIVLIGRMKKMEDSIRLGKPIELPQFRSVMIAEQVALLAALVFCGRDYIHNGIAQILRENGIA